MHLCCRRPRQLRDAPLAKLCTPLARPYATLRAHRKRALLAHLHATRQRLLRLHVLAQWGNMVPAADAVSRALDAAARQSDAARDAADQLALTHAQITAVQVDARHAEPQKEQGALSLNNTHLVSVPTCWPVPACLCQGLLA